MITFLPLKRLRLTLFMIFSFLGFFTALGQAPGCPSVDAGDDTVIDCSNGSGCVNLTADFLPIGETTTYDVSSIDYAPPFPFTGLSNPVSVGADDVWSEVITLPFEFCFFDGTYSEVVIGSNGIISFDTSQAGTFCDFTIGETELIPNVNLHQNAIMMYHDIDPRWGVAEVGYEIIGEYPCRTLVVSFANVHYYNFSNPTNGAISTFQIVLYETTNAIEFYLQTKPDPFDHLASPINGGRAVLGIQNSNATEGFTPPGRNTSVWEAFDEAWRFTPAGTPVYTLEWTDSNGTVVGDEPTIEVCPSADETYTASVTYTNCNGDTVMVEDDVLVTVDGGVFSVDLGGDQIFCDTPSYDITAELEDADPADATFLWSTGETTQTITVTTTDVYSCEVTVDGCTIVESVEITFLTSPNCTIAPVCQTIDFEENFGTGTGRVCDLNGATTTYTCNTSSQVEDGEYSISNTSTGLNSGWHIDMEDHTVGDVDGRMLFVNADFSPGEFYRRTITLTANEDYTFDAWLTSVYDTDTNICGGNSIPSNVLFRIEDTNGNLIEEVATGDIVNGPDPNWQQYSISFNTGANTDIQLVLINNSAGGCGNDIAIDDITLTLESGEPNIETPDDLSACDETGNEEATFNLEDQIPTILNGQDPVLFNVTFHLTQLEAEANINAITTPDAYQNANNPETIYVRVEKASDPPCFSTVNFELMVDPVLDLDITLPETIDICSTDPLPELDATPQNSEVDLELVTYEWRDGSGTIVSTEAIFIPTAPGIYTVTVSYAPCNEETYTVTLSIVETPTLELGDDVILCEGESYEIIPEIGGNTEGISYLWSTGETTETIIVDASGTYSLEITVGPCVVSDSVNIEINQNPEVFIGEDFKTCPDEPNVLTATSSDTGVTYQWFQNGDLIVGATESTYEFMLPPNTVGEQIFMVEVAAGSCVSSAAIAVQLYDVDNCTISEGLSPNGDGKNDCLNLEFLSDRTEGFSLEVFNRYGMSLYDNANYINEFCGLDRDGNELPTGTYFYVIKFNTPDPIYGEVKTGYIYINKDEN